MLRHSSSERESREGRLLETMSAAGMSLCKWCTWGAVAVLLAGGAAQAAAPEDRCKEGGSGFAGRCAPATWQVQWHNDGFASSDNQFTAGFALRKHSALASSLEGTGGTPAFGKFLARRVLPDRPELSYRETWGIGQNMQTPDDLTREHIILNDVPYMGMIGWTNSFIAFDDTRLTGFGLLLGWVGDSTLADEVQTAAHELTGAKEPLGWDHQLEFEPLINAYYMQKRKLWKRRSSDGALNFDLAAGNFFTFAQAALELRGGNAPAGFAPVPDPIGRGLAYDATLREPGAIYTYVTAVVRGTAIAHALPLEGNTFRDDNDWTENNVLETEELVGQLILGVHHERPGWGIHFQFWISTDTVEDNDHLFPSENPRNNFGTLTLEWRAL